MPDAKYIVRCRGIIFHEDKLLVVRHPHDKSYVALPGGRLEPGEDIKSCMKREIIEELGVEPTIGRLLYVHTFIDGDHGQSVEFFFEILNGKDYLKVTDLRGTHAYEIAGISWIGPDTSERLLPEIIGKDLRIKKLIADTPRFISDLKAR